MNRVCPIGHRSKAWGDLTHAIVPAGTSDPPRRNAWRLHAPSSTGDIATSRPAGLRYGPGQPTAGSKQCQFLTLELDHLGDPIQMTKGRSEAKELVLLIHGTFGGDDCTKAPLKEEQSETKEVTRERAKPARVPKWWHEGGAFWIALQGSLGREFILQPYQWPNAPRRSKEPPHKPDYGPNSELIRQQSGAELLAHLRVLENCNDVLGYHLVAHSHGGSVAWHALQEAESAGIDLPKLRSWTTVATPFFRLQPDRLEWLNILPVVMFLGVTGSLLWPKLEPFSNWHADLRQAATPGGPVGRHAGRYK